MFVLVAAALFASSACGSDPDRPDATSVTLGDATTGTAAGSSTTVAPVDTRAAPPPGTVEILDFRFVPTELTVTQGETVTWQNDDPYDHWVVSTQPDVLDSGQLSQAQTYAKAFSQVGTYEYYCKIHNYMKAKVTVR
jgi:plastocyanin